MAQIVWQDVSSASTPLSVVLRGPFNRSKLNKVQGVFPPKGLFSVRCTPFLRNPSSSRYNMDTHSPKHSHSCTQSNADTSRTQTHNLTVAHRHTLTPVLCQQQKHCCCLLDHVARVFGPGQQTQVRGSVRQWCCR